VRNRWAPIPDRWTDDNIVRRQQDRCAGGTSLAHWVYDGTGSVRGRCFACLGRARDHHPLCPRFVGPVDEDRLF